MATPARGPLPASKMPKGRLWIEKSIALMSGQAVPHEMLNWFEKAAGSEAKQEPASQLLDFASGKFNRAAPHRSVAELEIVIAEVIEYMNKSFAVTPSHVREKSRAEKVEEPVHAGADRRILVGHGNVQSGGRLHRQPAGCGGKQKIRDGAGRRNRLRSNTASPKLHSESRRLPRDFVHKIAIRFTPVEFDKYPAIERFFEHGKESTPRFCWKIHFDRIRPEKGGEASLHDIVAAEQGRGRRRRLSGKIDSRSHEGSK